MRAWKLGLCLRYVWWSRDVKPGAGADVNQMGALHQGHLDLGRSIIPRNTSVCDETPQAQLQQG